MRTLLTFLLAAFFTGLYSQNNVVFQVDMNEYSGAFDIVNLNGTFNDWCGECAVMTDDDMDGVYELAVDLPNGLHEYKFTVDGWTDDESFAPGLPCTMTTGDFTNRVVNVSGNATLDVVCWESCEDCGSGPVSGDITFRVDMSEYPGTLGVVNLNGTFNNWCGACAIMTDDDNDNVYELTVTLPIGLAEYKFTVDGWEIDESLTEGDPCTITTDGFTNRFVNVSEDEELSAVCWESCESCTPQALEDIHGIGFDISPNPSDGIVRIDVPVEFSEELRQIAVYSMNGKRVKEMNGLALRNGLLDLSELENGLYLLSIEGEQVRMTELMVVQH